MGINNISDLRMFSTLFYPTILLLSIFQYVVSTPCSAQSSGSAVKHGQLKSTTSGEPSKGHVVGNSELSCANEGELKESGNCDMAGSPPVGVVLLDGIKLVVDAGGVGPGLMFTVPRKGTWRCMFSPLEPGCR